MNRYDAYDGAPFSDETTGGAVHYLDLAVPQLWLPRYDWVICLEVVEHVPVEFESIVLDNVVRPATVGIVLSWAVPTQPGAMHVNPRSPAYVEEELSRRGLTLDADATRRLRNGSELSWFQQNTVVYRKTPPPSRRGRQDNRPSAKQLYNDMKILRELFIKYNFTKPGTVF